ncbi:MAG: ImmA/IrrE family metallo-endopeptidase [Planctomycetota bacterium]
MTEHRRDKSFYAKRLFAAKLGEETAGFCGFDSPPVDPFAIAQAESDLIHLVGDDFGNCFDGYIEYAGEQRFIICYNTKYNNWRHSGDFHTKILFTIAHELGHFFIEEHRRHLVGVKTGHVSFSEFSSDSLIEQQADYFAAGLLMPSSLLGPEVNTKNFPSHGEMHDIRRRFNVSLTGFLARWTQLSDFPCATVVVQDGLIQFGWISECLRELGAFRLSRGEEVSCKDASAFLRVGEPYQGYRDAEGSGSVANWIEYDRVRLPTQEFYYAIPHSNSVWILLIADESDLPTRWGEE